MLCHCKIHIPGSPMCPDKYAKQYMSAQKCVSDVGTNGVHLYYVHGHSKGRAGAPGMLLQRKLGEGSAPELLPPQPEPAACHAVQQTGLSLRPARVRGLPPLCSPRCARRRAHLLPASRRPPQRFSSPRQPEQAARRQSVNVPLIRHIRPLTPTGLGSLTHQACKHLADPGAAKTAVSCALTLSFAATRA